MTCRINEHDDYVESVSSGTDRQGRPWIATHWKCRKCGRTWTETTGPGV